MNQLTNIFKLLSDETRLRMLMLLYREDLCVCELADIIEVPQPRISKNLAKFRDLDLVNVERKNKFIFYRLKDDHTFLIHMLESIYSDIDHYPELKRDQINLIKQEGQLRNCLLTR